MLNIEQFRVEVVRYTTKRMDMWSQSAENLLVGTAIAESNLQHLKQIGGGPALGLFQCEPNSHNDLYDNYLHYRPGHLAAVTQFIPDGRPNIHDLITNMAYACAVARMMYYRVPEALPDADDIDGLANYWKDHYNTHLGAGYPEKWASLYRQHCGE